MRTLLLADDSITVQRVIALTFAGEPIQVVAVSDGQQAMAQFAAQRPDIVLASTTLSQVSGYDLARFVRSKADVQEVPVLLLSGAFETVDEAKLQASGANGIIEKPVEPIAVIARVKELLGLKSAPKPATVGRLLTSIDGPSDKKLPGAKESLAAAATTTTPSNWEQLREQSGLSADTQSVEAPSRRSKADQSTLDVAFDSLDQQISGRASQGANNPPGPIGPRGGAVDPRSPGRMPEQNTPPGNPVFEVDDQWFGGESRAQAEARAGRREIMEDLGAPELQAPPVAAESVPAPVFEVDEEWFADGNKTRAARLEEQRQLAAEMGIHDVDLPKAEAPLDPAPVAAHDFDFNLADVKALEQAPVVAAAAPAALETQPVPEEPQHPTSIEEITPAEDPTPLELIETAVVPEVVASIEVPAPIEPVTPVEPVAPVEPVMPIEPVMPAEAVQPVAPVTPIEPDSPIVPTLPVAPSEELKAVAPPANARGVADDFAALLAYEQGEPLQLPVMAAPVELAAPQITDDMLDQIAARVADRLSAGLLGEQLKAAVADAVRDTVRSVVSETSERLVRDEIDRIKSRTQS